jgi:hypothetical protein
MVIHNADTPVLDPHGSLAKIVVDGVKEALAGVVLNPASIATCRIETVETCNEQRTTGLKYAHHFLDRGLDIGNIDQR